MLELHAVPPDQLSTRTADASERLAAMRVTTRYLEPDEAREQVADFVERSADRAELLDVVDGDDVVGWVWLGGDRDEFVLYDVLLDDPARAAELLPGVLDRARAAGARKIGLGSHPGDPSRSAVAALPGFIPRATNMALPLDVEIAGPGDLRLQPMSEPEFDAFLAVMADDYAGELAAAGMSPEAAAERSRDQLAELIPSGLASPGMSFFTAWVGDHPVGRLWLSTQARMAFVYDVEVDSDQRRRGYGAAIMNAGARWCREQGHVALGLNVFAHNPGARALYDRLGYHVTFDYRTLDVPDAG
jgi:GNAT superfamily N-acetyltransferase